MAEDFNHYADLRRRDRRQQRHQAAQHARYQRNPAPFHAKARRWHERNAERRRLIVNAAAAVAYALKTARIVRPAACEVCHVTGVRISAAHADYTRPLEVRWLCARCHRQWDMRQPKTFDHAA